MFYNVYLIFVMVVAFILLQTRILVTHGVHFLPRVDKILVVSDGTISEAGTYEELLARKGQFSEFLKTHTDTDHRTGTTMGPATYC